METTLHNPTSNMSGPHGTVHVLIDYESPQLELPRAWPFNNINKNN